MLVFFPLLNLKCTKMLSNVDILLQRAFADEEAHYIITLTHV